MTEPAWEAWLRERFPAWLLRDSRGTPRPVAAVEVALARLYDSPGALARLAELAFLLDPEAETRAFVLESVPVYLRSVLPTTRREIDEHRGASRGRVDWARTLDLRRRTRDPSWFVCSTPRRTFEVPELILVRWLLHRVLVAMDDFGPHEAGETKGWQAALSAMHTEASRSLVHAALRDVPLRRLDEHERARCAHSPSAAIQQAMRVLDWHDRLLPTPTLDALARSAARFSLEPLSADKRFELFAMLSVMECIDRLLPGAMRVDHLIRPDRPEAALWTWGDDRLRLYYDQGAGRGRHADVMAHYFGVATGVRPDIRLVRRFGDGQSRTLYLDAKNSQRISYLAGSHLKMHGYIADRPGIFAERGARTVIICPVEVRGAPREGDAVVFVGAGGCGAGGALEGVLRGWLV